MKSSITEWFESLAVLFRSRLFEAIERLKVRRTFYRDSTYHLIDRDILALPDPFTTSKQYLQREGAPSIYQYGETPLSTLFQVGNAFRLTERDVLIEMGAGQGRGAFFIRYFFGCQVIGVEQVPLFVTQANALVEKHRLEGIEFLCGDMLHTSLEGATLLYLYQTMLTSNEIYQLIERLKGADTQLAIITVSYPLSDYDNEFEVIDQIEGEFIFGKTDVYLNKRCTLNH